MTDNSRSRQLFSTALARTPAGTHSNTRNRSPHPYYVVEADGAYVVDADGRRLLDFIMGNGSVILGHNHPEVQAAVRQAVARGATAGFESPDAVAAVELLAALVPGVEAIRFANTGTEAVMHALRIARAATGRSRIAKVEASYQGWADPVWVSTWPPLDAAGPADAPSPVPGSAGLAAEAATTVVLPFNDVAATTAVLKEHRHEVAAVIVEPVMIDIGFVPASQEYVDALRELTRELGIVLIFDELLTGFRVAPGGARELYGVTPDLTTYGKAIANGYPVAAVEGRRDLLDLTDPSTGGQVGWVGTYNAHAIAMAATRATLTALRTGSGDVQRRLTALTDQLRDGVARLASRYDQPAVLAGGAGHFQPYFRPGAPTDYRSAATTDAARYRAFVSACEARSVIVAGSPLGHSALSTAHTSSDVQLLLDCVEAALSTGE